MRRGSTKHVTLGPDRRLERAAGPELSRSGERKLSEADQHQVWLDPGFLAADWSSQ